MPVYEAERDARTPDTQKNRQIATQNIYPPNTLFLVMPFAMLPPKIAGVAWLILTLASFIVASLLVWDLSADYAPALSGALIGFLLANSELLAVTGNVAGLAISFCAVAVWCFTRRRFMALGVLCLALSLALKPHDTGLVWLYFLLAGAEQRKRALQSLAASLALSVPGLVWVWRVAPHWINEWSMNLAAYSAHGGVNDPGLSSSGGHGLDKLISLQAAFSFFRDEPRFYNLATYVLCAPLIFVLVYLPVRRPMCRNARGRLLRQLRLSACSPFITGSWIRRCFCWRFQAACCCGRRTGLRGDTGSQLRQQRWRSPALFHRRSSRRCSRRCHCPRRNGLSGR